MSEQKIPHVEFAEDLADEALDRPDRGMLPCYCPCSSMGPLTHAPRDPQEPKG